MLPAYISFINKPNYVHYLTNHEEEKKWCVSCLPILALFVDIIVFNFVLISINKEISTPKEDPATQKLLSEIDYYRQGQQSQS